MEKIKTPQFSVSAKTCFLETESKPESNYYFFSYHICITNNSNTTSQLMSRHWIITDGNGKVEEVRGAGVIGQQPRIKPGQTFEYDSACSLSTCSGTMRGFYQFTDKHGESFEIEIPEFYLIAPQALH